MRTSWLLACAAPVLLTAALIAPAMADTTPPPTLYVLGNPTTPQRCDDSGSGTYSLPFCDVQAAANVVVPGQTVVVNNDVINDFINGDIHITRSGTPGAPIVFKVANVPPSNGDQSSVIVNSGTNGFVLDDVHDVTIEGFQIQGTASTGIVVNDSSDITLDHDSIDLAAASTEAGDGVAISGTSSNVTVSRGFINTNDADVSVGPGVTGTDVAENLFSSGAVSAAVAVDGAANTDITNNTASFASCPRPMEYSAFSVSGSATGTSIENNIAQAQCGIPIPLLTVAADSAASTHSDYNLVYANGDNALYSWAGTIYGSAAQLTAATGQGTHDLNASQPLNGVEPEGGPAVDSADANAPGILSTDYDDNARTDDPSIANTGTGIGYVDRGAAEVVDPMTLSATVNTQKAPVGGTVVATLDATQGWAPITGYTVDFGDGTAPTTSTSPTISHTYTTLSDAPYQITASATDSLGNTVHYDVVSYEGVSVVAPAPLVPVLITGSLEQPGQLAYYADLIASTDSWTVVSATCDFGDGSALQQASDLSCNHVYAKPGTYLVTMTATDAGGNTATASQELVVHSTVRTNPQPVPGGGSCKVCY